MCQHATNPLFSPRQWGIPCIAPSLSSHQIILPTAPAPSLLLAVTQIILPTPSPCFLLVVTQIILPTTPSPKYYSTPPPLLLAVTKIILPPTHPPSLGSHPNYSPPPPPPTFYWQSPKLFYLPPFSWQSIAQIILPPPFSWQSPKLFYLPPFLLAVTQIILPPPPTPGIHPNYSPLLLAVTQIILPPPPPQLFYLPSFSWQSSKLFY